MDLGSRALAELRTQMRAERRASFVAALVLGVLSAIFAKPWGFVLAGLVVVLALTKTPAFRALDRGAVGRAIRWVAFGTWAVAVAVAALVPEAFPIMIINLIGPLLTGAIYLDARPMRSLVAAGMVGATLLGTIAYTSPGVGLHDAVPEWFFAFVIVSYLVAHVGVLSVGVGVANRVRLATLRDALAANAALRHADGELRASRRRVVAAGDQERIRLERDIHDGAQQRLVTLAVRLQLASQLTTQGTPPTAESLDALHREARTALDELRELARGIYPAVLTERGLEGALRSLARRLPNDVDVSYRATLELDTERAAAVYFICAEALQNAAKHAAADTSIRLVVADDPDWFDVEISDDGPGFEPDVVGHARGLLNMADRAGAIGGELRVSSTVGAGTSVSMRLPVRVADSLDQ